MKLFNKEKTEQEILEERYHSTNYGRSKGWIVEYNGRPIAKFLYPHLDYPSYFEYRVVVVDFFMQEEMMKTEFWDSPNLKYLSRALNVYATTTPIINPKIEKGKKIVTGRYLYCDIPESDAPTIFDPSDFDGKTPKGFFDSWIEYFYNSWLFKFFSGWF